MDRNPSRACKLGQVVEEAVERGEICGAVAAVSTPRFRHMQTFGSYGPETGTPMNLDAIFRMASMTKPITAAAAMILVEEKKINLGAPIYDQLPELVNQKVLRTPDSQIDDTVSRQRDVTYFDLLTFQLGIGMYMGGPFDYPIFDAMRKLDVAPYWEAADWHPDEYLSRLGSLPLIHQPGETWMYHTGADILAIAIQRITGLSLENFLKERLFEPLEMVDSGYWVPEQNADRLTTCYYPQQEAGAPLVPWDRPEGRYRQPPNMPTALVSTASDYLNFADMLLGEGVFKGRRVLRPESVRMMMSDQLTPEQKQRSPAQAGFWASRGWGIGGTVYTRSAPEAPYAGSYSWFGGFGPSFVVDPKVRSTVLLMIPRLITDHSHTELGEAFQKEAYKFWLDP